MVACKKIKAHCAVGYKSKHGDAVLVNRKSTTWRGLDDHARQQPVLALLAAHPTLIKRPVIESDDNSFIGWTADVQAALGLC